MGSNPPIRAIPASVAEPTKHIAAFLQSTRPFATLFASRGTEYFTRSRAGGDVLTEEDWCRDYYDAPAGPSSSRQRRSLQSSGTAKRRESLAKPGPPPTSKRYATSARPTPYPRRSANVYSPLAYMPAHGVPYADKMGRAAMAIETRDEHYSDVDSFGLHLNTALGHAVTAANKRLPALPISPPPEVADTRRDVRRPVPTGKKAVKLDALQTAIQRPGRLSLPRSGILARGVMSQPVKVSPYSNYELDAMAMQDMNAMPQTYLTATDARPSSRNLHLPMYSPLSPYPGEYSPHPSGSVPWSPWAAESPMSHHPHHHFGHYDRVLATTPVQWVDEIGSLYGLGDERPNSWDQADVVPYPLRPTISVEADQTRYRPISAPLPEAKYGARGAEGAMLELEATPSIEFEPLSPTGGTAMWGPRSDNYDLMPMAPGLAVGYSWPPTDPVTPVSPSEEVITFGWGPPQPSPPEPYWPTTKREPASLPAIHTLSLQSPAGEFSPYSPYPHSPYYPSPADQIF